MRSLMGLAGVKHRAGTRRSPAGKAWFERTVATGSLMAVALSGCSTPGSPVPVGSPAAAVRAAFAPATPFAVSCEGRTYFPDYVRYSECQAESEFILIFRQGDHQYAYTIRDGRVSEVSVTNHTISYP